MDKKKFQYIMPKTANVLKCPLPYFASKRNKTLYVLVPTSNPMLFNQVHEDFEKNENYSTDEEILPDFRCKICSVTVLNYFDFKLHLQSHKKGNEKISYKSFVLDDDQVHESKNTNKRLQSNISENIDNGTITYDPEYSSDESVKISTRLMVDNKGSPLKIIPNSWMESQKRCLFSNNPFDSLHNYSTPLNAFKASVCSNYEEPLEIQSRMLDSKLKKINEVHFPLTPTLKNYSRYMVTSKLSNHIDDANASLGGKVASDNGIVKSLLFNNLDSPEVLREEGLQRKDIRIGESSVSNTELILTHTGLKDLSSIYNKNITSVDNDNGSSFQSLSVNRPIKESNFYSENLTEKMIYKAINKLCGSISTPQPLSGVASSSISSYCETNNSSENSTSAKSVNYSEISSSNNSLVESEKLRECFISTQQPWINAKEKPLSCYHCKQIFESHFKLAMHLVQHQREKSIRCVLCNSSFSSSSSLRKHLQMRHGNDKIRKQCSFCNYRCFQASDLEKHVARRHTRDFKFKCAYCIKGFTTPKELNNHLRRKHPNKN